MCWQAGAAQDSVLYLCEGEKVDQAPEDPRVGCTAGDLAPRGSNSSTHPLLPSMLLPMQGSIHQGDQLLGLKVGLERVRVLTSGTDHCGENHKHISKYKRKIPNSCTSGNVFLLDPWVRTCPKGNLKIFWTE